MKIVVIGHPQTVQGFSLVGIDGTAVANGVEANLALDKAMADGNVGIVLLTSDVVGWIRARFDSLQGRAEPPVLVEISAPGQGIQGMTSLRQVVQDAVGIRSSEGGQDG